MRLTEKQLFNLMAQTEREMKTSLIIRFTEKETNNRCAFCEELLPVEKAPQNLMYIEIDETR